MNKIITIAKYTFLEIFKSKIFYYVVLSAACLAVLTLVAKEFTYGVPEKIVIDFGFGLSSLSSIGVSIFLGVSLLSREMEQRTIYMVLARPVTRTQFLIGRILGLVMIQFINMVLLGIVICSLFLFLDGQFSSILIWTNVFIFLESVVVLLLVIFLSLICNPTLSVINALIIICCGHFVNDALLTTFAKNHDFLRLLLKSYSLVFPAFYKLNLKDYVLYQNTLSLETIFHGLCYGAAYTLFLVFLTNLVFFKKNID